MHEIFEVEKKWFRMNKGFTRFDRNECNFVRKSNNLGRIQPDIAIKNVNIFFFKEGVLMVSSRHRILVNYVKSFDSPSALLVRVLILCGA